MKNLLLLLTASLALISCSSSDECRSDPRCTFESFLEGISTNDCQLISSVLCPETSAEIIAMCESGNFGERRALTDWIVDKNYDRPAASNHLERVLGVEVELDGQRLDDFLMVKYQGSWYIDAKGTENLKKYPEGRCFISEEN